MNRLLPLDAPLVRVWSECWRPRLLGPARRGWHEALLLRRAGIAAMEHDALTVAQAVAYSATVAIFPALIVLAFVLAELPMVAPVRRQLGVFFERVLPSTVLPLLSGYFGNTHPRETAGALLGALAVSLTGAANVMATLMDGFRRAHDLPQIPRSFWRRRLRAIVLVPLSLVPMAMASALVVFGNTLTHWLALAVPGELRPGVVVFGTLLRWAVALAGSAGILTVIYHLGTDPSVEMRRHVLERVGPLVREPWRALRSDWSWRVSLPGATVATLLWFVSTVAFGWYVTRFANYGRVYGSLGAGIALMAWLYLIALSVLIGSEYNAQRARPHRDEAVLAMLWRLPEMLRRHRFGLGTRRERTVNPASAELGKPSDSL